MRKTLTITLLLLANLAWSQLTVTGTSPADNATNVPLTATISVAFSAPIDTVGTFVNEQFLVTNILNTTAMWYSPQHDTVYFSAILEAGKTYFFCLFSVKSATGGHVLQTPVGARFTTGSSFPAYSLSGTVLQGVSSFSPANAMVIVTATPMTSGKPELLMGAIADGAGAFTIPHLGNGTYYVTAAKDIVQDGRIESTLGDAVGFSDAIIVNNANVTGATVAFSDFGPVTWNVALDSVAQNVTRLPVDVQLRVVSCWDADSMGRGRDGWEFSYVSASHVGIVYKIRVGSFGTTMMTETNPGMVDWIQNNLTQVPALSGAALPQVFVSNVEAAGGLAYRNQTKPLDLRFARTLSIARLAFSGFWNVSPPIDQNTIYWGAEYRWYRQITPDSSIDVDKNLYVGDFTTGGVLRISGVEAQRNEGMPTAYSLEQNYPNPFNPSTIIRYSLPQRTHVTLTVFNALGQHVATLVNSEMNAGYHEALLDGTALSSGIYLCRIQVVDQAEGSGWRYVETKKIVLLR
jgi:hypothetical protein